MTIDVYVAARLGYKAPRYLVINHSEVRVGVCMK